MEFIDYYKILGVSKNATAKDIKKAFRKLARQYHPDLHPNDAEAQRKFQQINEANEVLSDPEKRKKYDQYGKDWQHAEQFEQARQQQQHQYQQGGSEDFGFSSGGFSSGGFEGGDFSDFFASMFGGGTGGGRRQGRRAQFKGADFQAELHLSLQAAYTTHKQTLTVNNKKVRITIPAGIEDGQKIKLAGYGAPGANGGPGGDLYITFVIENDPRYQRKGNDLYVVEELPLYTAVLGGEHIVTTLSGKVRVTVKPLTQNGTTIRLKGKGFPVYKQENKFGDLFVKWKVMLPTRLTAKQKQLFEQLSAS